jgi:hypothetical protein
MRVRTGQFAGVVVPWRRKAAPRPVEETRGGQAAGDYTVSAGRQSLGNSKTPIVGGMPSAKCREARRQSLWD